MKTFTIKKIIPILLLSSILISFTLYNKNYFTDLVKEKLETYSSINYPEKIYIQTDKPYYSLDENIWFTSYLVDGISHEKSKKSTVLYVELINDKDSILDKKQLYTNAVTATGDFKISKKWKQGKYLLRAYTNAMRNQGSDYFFQKEILILATKKNDSLQEGSIASKSTHKITNDFELPRPDLNFYPEGGYLIEGIQNKIAIKIKNKLLGETLITGTINDNEGTEVFNFKTLKFGLCYFTLNPEPNKSYYASIYINGAEERYPLPKALPKGYTLNLVNNGDHILIDVNSTTETGLKGSFLVGHQRGQLFFSKLETSIKNKYSINLPTKDLKNGVAHITLFDPSGNPFCERLVYINNPSKNATIHIKKDKNILKSRKKQTISLDVTDTNGLRLSSFLSMAVRDLAAFPQNTHSENIKTWLLLNSDLRGEIKNPGYFFEKENDYKRRYLLDLVMLTNGWRRFTWNELLYEEQNKTKFSVEKGIHIKGRTLNLNSPYRAKTAATRMSFLGKRILQENQQSNANGVFDYGPFVFFDSIPTLIEARLSNFKSKEKHNRNVLILLNKSNSSPKISRNALLKSTISDEKQMTAFLKISKYMQDINLEFDKKRRLLDEVVIKAKKEEVLDEKRQAMNDRTNYGEPSDRIVMDELLGSESQSIFDLLRYVSGVSVSGTSVSIRGGGSPAFYLDGMQIDSTFLESISSSEISFIDVLKGVDAAAFMNGGNGVIALYSATGTNTLSKNVKRKPGIIDFKSKGFYTAKEFYAPDHINGAEELMKVDIRTTLHWEPQIRILETDKAEISFFTSDSKGDYLIEVEGISDTGIPVYSWTTFTVE